MTSLSSYNIPDTSASDRPEVTVFCAVWHKQPGKLELLRSHYENLKRQSLRVELCYIFDNGDTAPDWLDAPWHTFSIPLTIYEAWSAAVALAKTRYVMNLNMDDRLSTDAVQLLLEKVKSENLTLAGGEWHICFEKTFHTEAFDSFPIKDLTFKPEWPPRPHENLRLGSSSERGTFGPATMWDLTKTKRWYPTYFGNRDPILSVGDTIFWTSLLQSGHKMGRLATVIGRYYSSPDAQAEFRPHNDDETLKKHSVHQVSFAQCVPNPDFPLPKAATPAAPATSAAPRNSVEAQSHALAQRYLAMFGRSAQTSMTT